MGIFDRLLGNKTGQNTVRKENGDIDVSPTSVPSEGFSSPSGGENEESIVIGGERFIFSDLTAEDKETGLVWTRDANVAGRSMKWSNANDFITQLNRQRYAGYNDWRLPAKEEFLILLYYAASQGHKKDLYNLFNKIGFKNVQTSCWSSTTHANYANDAWIVDMWLGYMRPSSKSNPYNYVWPVRSGP